MLLVYIFAHTSEAILPLQNKGELALLYLPAFLVIFAMAILSAIDKKGRWQKVGAKMKFKIKNEEKNSKKKKTE